jgi:UDP-N-acetylmuramyl tripeptide synthase
MTETHTSSPHTVPRNPTFVRGLVGSTRAHAALLAGRVVTIVVRRVRGRGGNTIGGRVALAIAPDLLGSLLRERDAVFVTGTNGKTTTTGLLAAALASDRPIVSNRDGDNLPRGLATALMLEPDTHALAVLEVDELYIPAVLAQSANALVVLLNLSRDQLDRTAEVSSVALRWRRAFAEHPPQRVIANADDPVVVSAVGGGIPVTWVAAGLEWRNDAIACGTCSGHIVFTATDWSCDGCDRRRPVTEWKVRDQSLVGPDGIVTPLLLAIPGRHNIANAAMAMVAAHIVGMDLDHIADAFAAVPAVAGRAARLWGDEHEGRLFLAKNPAGFAEVLELLVAHDRPVLLCINAHGVDGRDTSWLYDVDFERLGTKPVLVSGERGADMAVRLQYAAVAHERVVDLDDAIARAREVDADVVCTYSAFRSVMTRTGVAG